MNSVSCLPPLSQLVLKIIAVLGGVCNIQLIEQLLETASFVKDHYTKLCQTFDRIYDKFSRADMRSKPKGSRHSSYILSIVLHDMKAKGLLEVTSDSVRCMDCCFIDALYQNIAFAHRRELHRMAAETMADSSRTEGAVLLLPSIIHHFMMSEDEARAESYLKVFQGFFGNFIDKFIIDMVKKYVPSAVGLDGRTQDMTGSIARKCLHALPHMR